jgi:hypothetical protein
MRATPAVAATTVALLLAGCGSNPQSEVRAKVREFARAAAGHDYATICRDVLAPSLLADIARGGITCEQALQTALRRVQNPHLVIGPTRVSGRRASVLTISQASGQGTALSSLRLVDTSRGWRISALGSPTG